MVIGLSLRLFIWDKIPELVNMFALICHPEQRDLRVSQAPAVRRIDSYLATHLSRHLDLIFYVQTLHHVIWIRSGNLLLAIWFRYYQYQSSYSYKFRYIVVKTFHIFTGKGNKTHYFREHFVKIFKYFKYFKYFGSLDWQSSQLINYVDIDNINMCRSSLVGLREGI
jgi:hypothetical protein